MELAARGQLHDKHLADEHPLRLSAGSMLRQSLGLPGPDPPDARVGMSKKKPLKRELPFAQLLYNQLFLRYASLLSRFTAVSNACVFSGIRDAYGARNFATR